MATPTIWRKHLVPIRLRLFFVDRIAAIGGAVASSCHSTALCSGKDLGAWCRQGVSHACAIAETSKSSRPSRCSSAMRRKVSPCPSLDSLLALSRRAGRRRPQSPSTFVHACRPVRSDLRIRVSL